MSTWLLSDRAASRRCRRCGARPDEAELDDEAAAGIEDPCGQPGDRTGEEGQERAYRKCLTGFRPSIGRSSIWSTTTRNLWRKWH